MAITGEGVYHHGMKNMIPGPVILWNRSFQVEDLIFVHFTRHTFQVATLLIWPSESKILHVLR
jgi:hypothetical protein